MTKTIWSSLTRHPRWTSLSAIALLSAFPLLPNALTWPARVLLLGLVLALGSWAYAKVRSVSHNPKPAIFGLVAVLLSFGIAYGFLEMASWVYLKKVPKSDDPLVLTEKQKKFVMSVVEQRLQYEVYSPTIGWTIAKNQVSENGLYKSNAEGFRANREYTTEKAPGKIRVLTFGDSYTHGDEVGNDETWQTYAEQESPDMEFLNFGVPGYSLTQAYLRYKEVASTYPADYVIIGCMSEDLKRSVNVYYPFRYGNPDHSPNAMALPYASLDDAGELVVNPPAISSREGYAAFAEHPKPLLKAMSRVDILFSPQPATPLAAFLADRWESLEDRFTPAVDYAMTAWHRAIDSDDKSRSLREREARKNGNRRNRIIDINCRLFERFAQDVKKNGSVPLIVWFPSPFDIDACNEGKAREYEGCFTYFEERHMPAVDTLDWLKELAGPGKPLPAKTLLTGVHFSPSTNAHVGKRLTSVIRNMATKAAAGPK
jgi:hypothetical protein